MTLIEAVNAWQPGKRLRRARGKESFSLYAVLECCDAAAATPRILRAADIMAPDWEIVSAEIKADGPRRPVAKRPAARPGLKRSVG